MSSVPFLISILEYVCYRSCYATDNMDFPALENGPRNIMRCNSIRGFHVAMMSLSMKFKDAKDRIKLGLTINIESKGERVIKIECFHQVL